MRDAINITILPELRDLIPPLSPEEFAQLEANILDEGIREPLTVWNRSGQYVLIDGHHRYKIAQAHGLEFQVEEVEFSSEEEAADWMDRNQLGRRNLSPEQMSLLRGRRYNRVKRSYSEAGAMKGKSVGQNDPGSRTSERIASDHNVSEKTIRRDGKFAAAVETLAEKLSQSQNEVIEKFATKKDVVKAAEIIAKDESAVHEVWGLTKEKKRERAEILIKANNAAQAAAAKVKEYYENGSTDFLDYECQIGKWYHLGPHKIYCGDNTDEEFLSNLPKKNSFAFADPPYNANAADWDNGFLWRHDYLADIANVVAVTPGIGNLDSFFKQTTMPYRWSVSTWIKNGMTRGAMGFGNWIYTAIFSNGSVYKNRQDFYAITISSSGEANHYHKGRKPILYLHYLLDMFSDSGDTIVDPFLGSGTTLFACEEMDRICYGAEINPVYCKMIIDRYEKKNNGFNSSR